MQGSRPGLTAHIHIAASRCGDAPQVLELAVVIALAAPLASKLQVRSAQPANSPQACGMARAFGSRLGFKQAPPPKAALLRAALLGTALPAAIRTVYRAGGGSACGCKAGHRECSQWGIRSWTPGMQLECVLVARRWTPLAIDCAAHHSR